MGTERDPEVSKRAYGLSSQPQLNSRDPGFLEVASRVQELVWGSRESSPLPDPVYPPHAWVS